VFGSPSTGKVMGQATLDGTFRDGLSETIMFAERYASCGNPMYNGTPIPILSNLWADTNPYFRPSFCIDQYNQIPSEAGYLPCLTPQNNPAWDTQCETTRTQSGHPGIVDVCMGDGNVVGAW
jgi:hypothetical protein